MSKSLLVLVCAILLAGAAGVRAQGTADCSQAAVHWASVEAIGTREAYEDHLARFPTCAFATLAKVRLSVLGRGSAPAAKPPAALADCSQAEAEWQRADSTGTRQAYEDHLARFPNCGYATLAKVRLAAFGPASAPSAQTPAVGDCSRDEAEWTRADSTQTRQAYEDYLARFPNCDHATLAKVRLATFGPASAPGQAPVQPGDCSQAEADWNRAEAAGTRQAYEDHIARFPNCGYATLAKVRIAALGQRSDLSPQPPAAPAAAVKICPAGQIRDSDGDCVRERVRSLRSARTSAPSRVRASIDSEPATPHGLNCSDPAQVMACASKALGTLPH